MRRIWLASYPKSGNTWVRILLANLTTDGDTPADINDLPRRNAIASAREPFDHLTLIDSTLLTHEEIDHLRPLVYAEMAKTTAPDDDDSDDTLPVRFIKTHDAYAQTASGDALLAGSNGAIVIVRDPRDVAPSIANHKNSSIDEAIAFMNSRTASLCGRTDRAQNQFRQHLSGWSDHIESWLSQSDIPVHVMRYEDLQDDAAVTLRQALAFAQCPAGDDAIARAVRLAGFAGLQAQERDKGFREAPRPHRATTFFRRGESGAWRDELTAGQVAAIEAQHAPMMRRLGYRPVSSAILSRAG